MQKLHDEFKNVRKAIALLEIEAGERAPDFAEAQTYATVAQEAIGRIVMAIEERIQNARNIAQSSLSAGRIAGDVAQATSAEPSRIRE